MPFACEANSFVSHKCQECCFVFDVMKETRDYNNAKKIGINFVKMTTI